MKRFVLFAVLALLTCVPLATSQASAAGYSREEIIYGRTYGTALTMDVFTPKSEAAGKGGNGAGIIFVVSGGWFSDHKAIDGNIATFIQPLLDHGYTVFAVCHGSSPKFTLPEILQDMHRSVRFIRYNAKKFGIDPDRIGITGGSAGGHLALMQGCAGKDGDSKATDPVDRESSRVQAVVSFFPPTDFLNWGKTGQFMLGKHPIVPIKGAFDFNTLNKKTQSFEPIAEEKQRVDIGKDMSPIYHVAKNNAPTLIVHGDKDALVPINKPT
jgi:acetyl esterase/lipase